MLFEGTMEAGKINNPDFIIAGCPMDLTESYRNGTSEAPVAVRNASVSIESYSPFLDKDLKDYRVVDDGDLRVEAIEKTLLGVESYVNSLNLPFCLVGGEHTLTFGALRALYKKHKNLVVVVLDAHTDMRDEYEGLRISHATWLKRTLEFIEPSNVALFGVRSGTRNEFERRDDFLEFSENLCLFGTIKDVLVDAEAVYLSIDIDVLDSCYVPGCSNPEPGGPTYLELEEFVHWIGINTNLIGFDLVEVSPKYDISSITPITAARIIRETILASI